MSFEKGEKVFNRKTQEVFTVVSTDCGLVLENENGDIARYYSAAFKRLTLTRADISVIKKGLREYVR